MSCKTEKVKFKTKRGRTITFTARVGDSCKPKAKTAAQRTQQKEFAAAGRACYRKLGKSAVGTKRFGACMKQALR